MKKSLLIAALAVFTMASCSKDEVVSVPQNEIQFAVVTDNATKAADVYCAYNKMDEFKVCASYFDADKEGNKYISYFAKDVVKYDNTSRSWKTDGATRYWPAFESEDFLTFYALAGTISDFTWTTPTSATKPLPTIDNYMVNDNVANQEDILYSRSEEFTAKMDKAKINFRHAMSLIEFKAKNSTNSLHVIVDKVCVGGVSGKGKFTFPESSTSDNWVKHNDTDVNDENIYNQTEKASWLADMDDANIKEYITAVSPSGVYVVKGVDAISLTTSNDVVNPADGAFKNSMLLMPQTVDAYSISTGKGAYMGVYCKIYNMAGTNYEPATDVLVYEGWAMVHVGVNWALGKKYIYTFNFVDGDGGNDGGKDPEDPEPGKDPVMFTITYDVTVDDFDLVKDQEIKVER